MENDSNNLTHKIIQAHMQYEKLSTKDLIVSKGFKYGLYTYDKIPIHSQINDTIDFSKKYYQDHDHTFYINSGVSGHLGISYVVIKESILSKKTSQLLNSIVLTMVVLYITIGLIGYYLAKLFIFPIQFQREKLNNFIKDTTHELNTPLSALLLCVDSDNFSSEQNKQHIKISAKKISNLYKDLTYLFLKDHSEEKIYNIDISDILKNELAFYSELASKKKIEMTSDIESTNFEIENEDFIRLINNLISNAIKYTKRNGKISISLRNNVLIIKDNGIGIAKEQLDKIFERYYRATNSVGGFGIGLNIVYSICKQYNIKIDVESKIKEGTTFTLTFK